MDENKPEPIVNRVISTVGIKPATSKIHSIARAVVALSIIILVIWAILHEEENDHACMADLEEYIKPNTLLYQTIDELEDKTKAVYIKNTKEMINSSQTNTFKRYMNGIKVSLIAGIVSEYIVNGNTSKPLGVIGKTILYSIIYTTAT